MERDGWMKGSRVNEGVMVMREGWKEGGLDGGSGGG